MTSENKVYLNGVELGTVEDFNILAKGINEMTQQTIEQSGNVKPTQQALFDRLVNLYHEQATIGLDIKALSDEFKEYYPDAELATIKSVARAKAEESLGSKIDKAKLFEEVAETFVK